MKSASEALNILKEGNKRFVDGTSTLSTAINPAQRAALANGQEPFAIVLGCSDSRVPVELVFDQNLGDLFVVRVAGNIAATTAIGSIEFAATAFGTRLIIVLGHSHCGAIKATIQALREPSAGGSPNLGAIVEHISPAVGPILEAHQSNDESQTLAKAVQANIQAVTLNLREQSTIIDELIKNDGLVIIGAEYSLTTGEVEFQL